jgi:hypothetical protein
MKSGGSPNSQDEADLLRRLEVGALQDLDGQVRREGDDLGCLERRRGALLDVERAGAEDSREVEGGEGVEDDDLVGRVGVDGLVEREVRRVGVQRCIHGRVGARERRLREAGDELFEVGLALCGGDGRAEAVVVVERDVVEVCNEAGRSQRRGRRLK